MYIFNSIESLQKKHRRTLLLCFLIMLFVPHLTWAAPDLSVTSTSGATGNSVSVSAIADFSVAVNSMQFTLTFDPTLLTVSSVTTGSANNSWYIVNNSNTAGKVIVGILNTGGLASTVSGPQQQIAVINFTVNAPAGSSNTSSPLTLSSVSFDSTSVNALTAGAFALNVSYVLTVNTSGNGTVSVNPNSTTYSFGSQVVLTAIPSSMYQFSGWSGGEIGNTNPLTLTMNANTNITATFIVANVAPIITTQPTTEKINIGTAGVFSVVATGTAPLTYQWYKNGISVFGATNSSYRTPVTTSSNSGDSYTVKVSNIAGSETSSAAILMIDLRHQIQIKRKIY